MRASSGYPYSVPASLHARRHSCSSHSPAIFFNRRIFPPTPISLVKFSASVFAFTTGWSISTPINDHVPELM